MTVKWTDYLRVPMFYAMLAFFSGLTGLVVNGLIVPNYHAVLFWSVLSGFSLALIAHEVMHIGSTPAPKPLNYTSLDLHNRARLRTYPEGEYVYLVRDAKGTGHCKIGMTGNPLRRIAGFDSGFPFRVQVLAIYAVDDMRLIEKYLHDKYRRQRVNGEWFKLSDADIRTICELAD